MYMVLMKDLYDLEVIGIKNSGASKVMLMFVGLHNGLATSSDIFN